MASSGKKKTTMAKLMRESRLRERRLEKQAKRDARKHAPADGAGQLDDAARVDGAGQPGDALDPTNGASAQPDVGDSALETVAEARPEG
jgi:hypothetical protein